MLQRDDKFENTLQYADIKLKNRMIQEEVRVRGVQENHDTADSREDT